MILFRGVLEEWTFMKQALPDWRQASGGGLPSIKNRGKKRGGVIAFVQVLGVFGAAFMLAFMSGSINIVPRDSFAELDTEEYVDDESVATLATSLGAESEVLTLLPETYGDVEKSELTVSVATSNRTGYSLSISTSTESSSLKHMSGAASLLSSRDKTPGDLPINSWGYNTGSKESVSSFSGVPNLAETSAKLVLEKTPTDGSETTITVGARASGLRLPGDYGGTILFTIVSNYTSGK